MDKGLQEIRFVFADRVSGVRDIWVCELGLGLWVGYEAMRRERVEVERRKRRKWWWRKKGRRYGNCSRRRKRNKIK